MAEKPHKKLEAWRKAVDLVVAIYDTTRRFPSDERFGLAGQMQRAAISVPSNIAEGAARGSNRGFVNALHIARGSLSELDTQLIIAQRLGYIGEEELARLALSLSEVDRLLNGLIASVRRKAAAVVTCIALLLGTVGWLA
ncbi:MAG: four helix bundle protein [candidate division NC10 bacterium]|nr:four helix bundle protein [candidate division NC10 bacterium]